MALMPKITHGFTRTFYRPLSKKFRFFNEKIPNNPEKIELDKNVPTRIYEMSMTHQKLCLPLKKMKLSPPFPEPIKTITYHTISDEEKVELKRKEINLNQIRHFTMGSRCYSSVGSDPEKCKKMGKAGKSCPKMQLKGCDRPKSISCERPPKDLNCKKQDAPYPSYSELCAEDPVYKPSECRMCPWPIDEHPHFKPKKRKFHTSAIYERTINEMLCDLKKEKCKQPKSDKCSGAKVIKKPDKTKDKCGDKKKKSCLDQLNEMLISDGGINHPHELFADDGGCKKDGDGKCKKFPYQKCNLPKPKRDVLEHGCPKKKPKKSVIDCPPDKGGCVNSVITICCDKYGGDKGKKKCPEIDLDLCCPKEEPTCKKKPEGTRQCPSDLLKPKKKKNPKKKKTDGVQNNQMIIAPSVGSGQDNVSNKTVI